MLVNGVKSLRPLHRFQAVRSLASIHQDSFGNPLSVLRLNTKEAVVSDPEADEIQVKVTAALVSPDDVSAIRGEKRVPNASDFAGLSSVGEVTKVGGQVKHRKVGDQVLLFKDGAWADKVNVAASQAVSVSKSVSPVTAALFPVHLAAWALLQSLHLPPGASLFQAAPGTAVGTSVAALAKARGISVLEPTAEELLDAAFVRSHRGRHRAVVSGLGGRFGAAAVRVLGQHGKLICFKGRFAPLLEVATVDIPVSSAIFQDAAVEGFDLATWIDGHAALLPQAVADVEALLSHAEAARLPPTVTFPLKQYQAAIQAAAEQQGGAAVVLQW